jgi:hypothetical protein
MAWPCTVGCLRMLLTLGMLAVRTCKAKPRELRSDPMPPDEKARAPVDGQLNWTSWDVQSVAEQAISAACGRTEVPVDFAANWPHRYLAIPVEQRAARCHLKSHICVIDGKEFFVRSRLEIPVLNGPRPFVWGVWASLDEASYKQITRPSDNCSDEKPSYSSWLCTSIPTYPETLNLKAQVYIRPLIQRPVMELDSSEHLLALEQRNGITLTRVGEIVAALLQHRGKETAPIFVVGDEEEQPPRRPLPRKLY